MEHLVNLRPIYSSDKCECPASKVEIIESVFEDNDKHLKRFYAYLLIDDAAVGKFVQMLSIDLRVQKQKLSFALVDEVQQVAHLNGIEDLWSIGYFEPSQELFRCKTYFNSTKRQSDKAKEFLSKLEDNEEKLVIDQSKFNSLFHEYINNKTLKSIFQHNYDKNLLVCRTNKDKLVFMTSNARIFELDISKHLRKAFNVASVSGKLISQQRCHGQRCGNNHTRHSQVLLEAVSGALRGL